MNIQLMPDIAQQNYNYQHLGNTNTLERVCRTCLSEQGELRPLFSERLTEMLMSFTAVQVAANDGLPCNICTQCVLHISRAYNFKQQAEQSDSTLRQYIYQNAQDPLTTNILETNYDADNITTSVQQNIVSGKQEYFAVNHNLGQNNQIKSEIPNELPDSGIKLEDSEKESEENCDDNLQSENGDSDDDSSEDYSKECDICSLSFIDQKDYDKHMKMHSRAKKHVCSECDRSFQYKVGLKTHMRSHGIGEKKHKCKHCGKRFYELNDCVIHERKHTGEKPEICETCGKSFADPRSLAKHLKIHTGEKNYQCDVCNKKFIHSYTLTAHKRVHTGEKPFICNICAHACATSTQLTLHMRTHTKEKPYACPLCSKTFTSKSGLTTHQVTHTGERKYICLICGKGSRTSTDLNSHMRTHTGEKPYECKVPQCEKKYKTSSQLNAHMRTHTEDLSEEEAEELHLTTDSSVLSSKAESILSNSDFKAHFQLSKTSVKILLREINAGDLNELGKGRGRKAKFYVHPLLLVLWTLKNGESLRAVSIRFKFGHSYAYDVFMTACNKLTDIVHKFIKWPTKMVQVETIKKFKQTEDEFPDVIGALNYVYISVRGITYDSSYYNEDGYSSIILQGICNTDMEFIDICVDSPGSSKTSWLDSPIHNKLNDKDFLPGNTFIVADNDYETKDKLLALTNKEDSELNEEEKIFNNSLIKRLSCVKRSFQLLFRNFKILNRLNKYNILECIQSVIITTCMMHNIVLRENQEKDIFVENWKEETNYSIKPKSSAKNNVNNDEKQLVYVVNQKDLMYLLDKDKK